MIAKIVTTFELANEAERKHRPTSKVKYAILEEEAIRVGNIGDLEVCQRETLKSLHRSNNRVTS